MKNLPEKIYLNLNMTPQEVVDTKDKDFHEATKTWEITWSEECLSEHDPEYVRKDAFIKRVINFLNYKLFDVVATRVGGTIIPRHVAKQELIEDLEKYMKDYMKGE